MKRGEIYWNVYHDAMKRERRVPVVILSEDNYNSKGMFVTGLRMVQYDNNPCPQHVHIPASAFDNTITMTDCVALCETIGSIRQTSMQGPIAVINSAYYLNLILEGVKNHIGLKTETSRYMDGAKSSDPFHVIAERPTMEKPWYSANVSQAIDAQIKAESGVK